MDDLNELRQRVEKKDRSQFIAGLLIGILTTGVITLIVVLILMRTGVKSIPLTESFVSDEESMLDEGTIKKIEEIQGIFENKSIYGLDRQRIQTGLVDGFLAGTGDKYAYYYTAEEIEQQMSDYSGKFYGIGVLMGPDDDKNITVHKVYEDSPAQKAGIHEGDYLISVDGEDVVGMELSDVVAKVRGEKGTKVTIGIYRPSTMQTLECVAVRDQIKQIVVESKFLKDGIGYIHIQEWYDTTAEQFALAKDELVKQGMTDGLIIDLRSNTGGLVSAAVDTLEVCLPSGPVLYIEDLNGKRETYYAYDNDDIEIPIVILTNGNTASASEIFTGAMKDYEKAVTLGTKTYGKGVVQSFYYLYDGTAIKLTTQQYLTPNGNTLDGNGIEPDIEVDFDATMYYDIDNPSDNQLNAAIDYIKGLD